MNYFENIPISKYRNAIYGIATLGIIATHNSQYLSDIPNWIIKILRFGGSGVFIFAFLSGMGLFITLNREYNIRKYYYHRLKRVFIPYFIISFLWYGYKYIIIEHNIPYFFYEWSTLSFWGSHQGAWYVAMLIPVYTIWPFFYQWVIKDFTRRTILSLAIIIILSEFLFYTNQDIAKHLSQITQSLIYFVLGNYIGKEVKDNTLKSLYWFIGGIIIIFIRFLTNNDNIERFTTGIGGICITFAIAWILQKINYKFNFFNLITNLFSHLGKYSLESYLTNIFILQAVKYFCFDKILIQLDPTGILIFILIAVVGILTAIGLSKVIDFIILKRI